MIWLLLTTARVSVILIVALLLARMLRARTASLRHTVLLIALLCAAAVPVLGAFAPAWASRTIPVPSALQAFPVLQPRAVPGEMPFAPVHAAQTRVLEPAVPASTAQPAPAAQQWKANAPRILEVAWFVYISGAAVALATLLLGLLQLHWMTARAVPMHSKSWQHQAAAIADLYGLRRTVRLAHSRHAPVLAIWGVVRPQVLLPASAEGWSEDRIHAVLLHEFAHIRRNDWLVQMLAGVLRAIHWFNPLVWIACSRLRQESEQACDDAVLEQGVSGAEYAAHLLALARAFRQSAFLLVSPPSMAGRSTLLRRVAAILDPATIRMDASGQAVAKAAAALLCATLAAAALQIARPLRAADIRSYQSLPGIKHGEVQPAAVTAHAPTVVADVRAGGTFAAVKSGPTNMRSPEMPETPAQLIDAGETSGAASLRAMAADITDFAQSVLQHGALSRTTDYQHVRSSLGSVLRSAQRLVDDDAGNLTGLAARATALLAALADAANSAANIDSRPGTAWPERQALQQLEARLRNRMAQLGAVLLPLPAVSSIVVSTPERRAAVAALDLAQTARADPALGGWRPHVSLLAGLDTLERAAQSVLVGDDAERDAAAARLAALSTATLLTARVAANISGRDVEPAATRGKAADLAGSLRAIAAQLGAGAPPPGDSRWLGWALPDEVDPPTAATSMATTLPDRSKPPLTVASAGGFTMRRLAAPVAIDGQRWIAVNPIWGGTAVAPNRQFAVSLADENDAGDVARHRLAYIGSGGKPVALTPDVVAYAMVTPDSRWILFEQLDVIDVQKWQRYTLSRQFGITSYVVPKALSADGRHLVVSRSSCPFDCGNVPTEYYELGFPEPDQPPGNAD